MCFSHFYRWKILCVSEIFVTIGNKLMPIMADYIFQKWSQTYFLSPMLLHNLVGLCGGLC